MFQKLIFKCWYRTPNFCGAIVRGIQKNHKYSFKTLPLKWLIGRTSQKVAMFFLYDIWVSPCHEKNGVKACSMISRPGNARGCSTNTSVINRVTDPLVPTPVWRHHAKMVRVSSSSYKIDYVIVIKSFLNSKGHHNPITGSKVTAILLKGWICLLVEFHQEGSAPAACAARLFTYVIDSFDGKGDRSHITYHIRDRQSVCNEALGKCEQVHMAGYGGEILWEMVGNF